MVNPTLFDLIIFDWDGTLLNSVAPIVELIEAAKAPFPTHQNAKVLLQSGLIPLLEQLINDEHAFQINDLQLIMELAGLGWLFKQTKLYEGVHALISNLHHHGYQLVLVSGRSQAQLLDEVYKFDLGNYFSSVSGADKKRVKPDSGIVLDIVTRFNVDLKRTLLVGDSALDMEMALLADLPRVGVAYGTGKNMHDHAKSLKLWHPLAVASSLNDLHNLLLENI